MIKYMHQKSTHNTRDGIEEIERIADALAIEWVNRDLDGNPDGRWEFIKGFIHQELQKARESERKIIKLRIDYDRRKGIPAEETVNDIYDSIELKDPIRARPTY